MWLEAASFLKRNIYYLTIAFQVKSRYEASSDLRVELEVTLWLRSSEGVCFVISGPKLDLGQPNNQLKKVTV